MNQPLVTIWVVTYNSSATILETLESAKEQTYPNIELVISDDCSTDNTVELCENWLKENAKYFKRTALITSPVNTGVAPNCNRAIKASTGEWLKPLAGDDLLFPYSIKEYVKYINENPEAQIVFGKLSFFGENEGFVNAKKFFYEQKLYPKIKKNQKEQYLENLDAMFVPGPGLFFSRKLYDEIEGYDEKYPMCEEDPFLSYVLEKGYHIKFLDLQIYKYRVSEGSLGNVYSVHLYDRARFFHDHTKQQMKRKGLYFKAIYKDLQYQKIINSNNKIKYFLLNLKLFFNPYTYLYKFHFIK